MYAIDSAGVQVFVSHRHYGYSFSCHTNPASCHPLALSSTVSLAEPASSSVYSRHNCCRPLPLELPSCRSWNCDPRDVLGLLAYLLYGHLFRSPSSAHDLGRQGALSSPSAVDLCRHRHGHTSSSPVTTVTHLFFPTASVTHLHISPLTQMELLFILLLFHFHSADRKGGSSGTDVLLAIVGKARTRVEGVEGRKREVRNHRISRERYCMVPQ